MDSLYLSPWFLRILALEEANLCGKIQSNQRLPSCDEDKLATWKGCIGRRASGHPVAVPGIPAEEPGM